MADMNVPQTPTTECLWFDKWATRGFDIGGVRILELRNVAKGRWQPVLSEPLTSQWDPSLRGRVSSRDYVLPHTIQLFSKRGKHPQFPPIQFEDASGKLGMRPSKVGTDSVRCRQDGKLVEEPRFSAERLNFLQLVIEVRDDSLAQIMHFN